MAALRAASYGLFFGGFARLLTATPAGVPPVSAAKGLFSSPQLIPLDLATRLQHTYAMKSAVLPQVRVEPQLRADLEAVLREGETLSDFLEVTVRQAVDYRRMQAEFDARADAAWSRFQQTGAGTPAQELVTEMRVQLQARRRKLQGKHRPTTG